MKQDYRIATVVSVLWFLIALFIDWEYKFRGEEKFIPAVFGVVIIWVIAGGLRWINRAS